jgi:hypothetical protein
MATNLVEQVAATLGPVLVGRIASSLGLNETATQKASPASVFYLPQYCVMIH